MIARIIKVNFWECLLLFTVVAVAVLLRLYKIDAPLADWHSWRQADTLSVARNFYQEGFAPLYPKADDMASAASGYLVNLNRYRYVEFPIYPTIVYWGFLITGGVSLWVARVVNIGFSVGTLLFIYFLAKKHFDKYTALVSALIFGILPYSIYYSRTTLPEPDLVFFSLGMLLFFDRWFDGKGLGDLVLAIIFEVMAFLTKPMAVFYLLPVLMVTFFRRRRILFLTRFELLALILGLIPFVLWRVWMIPHPEGIPASAWLLNGNNIRFRPAFFYWIVIDRLGKEILSVTGFSLFILGVLLKPLKDNGNLWHWLVFSSFLYLVVFATGNVQHDYYQFLIVPALSVFVARGVVFLLRGQPYLIARIWTIPLSLILLSLMLLFTYEQVINLYHINNYSIVRAGAVADKILPKEAVVVAPYNGDTAFLYQINRHGFADIILAIPEMVKQYQVNYYISVNYDDRTNWVLRHYRAVVKTPEFVIVNLFEQLPGADFQKDKEPS